MIHTDIEDILKKKKSGDFYYPDYENYSLTKVPKVVESLLTQKDYSFGLLEKVRAEFSNQYPQKVVLFLLDGFGYEQWKKYSSHFSLFHTIADKGHLFPISTVFPSTTSAALTSLSTGLSPQEHGLLEWWVYYEELDQTIVTLPFTPKGETGPDRLREQGVDPHILFNNETVFERLQKENIKSYVFTPYAIALSAYSHLVNKGASIVPYQSASDLAVNLRELIESTDDPAYIYVYWSGIDTLAHVYAPHSEQYLAEVELFSHTLYSEFVEKLLPEAKENTLLCVTADHGQIAQPKEHFINLRDYPDIIELLACDKAGNPIMPWGSPRDAYVKAKYGSEGRLYRKLTKLLKGKADVVWSKDLVKTGIFGTGTMHPQWMKRVADIALLAHEEVTIWAEPRVKLGGHGGLTKEEMWIPFGVLEMKNT